MPRAKKDLKKEESVKEEKGKEEKKEETVDTTACSPGIAALKAAQAKA